MKILKTFILIFTVSIPLFAQEVALQEVKINAGDTMWSIANKYLKDPKKWTEIAKHNQLPTADPTRALPGAKIKIPIFLIKEEYRVAQLVKMIPEVRFKRKGDAEWQQATQDMMLKYEDNLRTMRGAEARVRFPSKEIVQINENSYVVLKPEKILQEIQLLQGDVRASKAKVIMPGGTVVKPYGNTSDYQAKVREDETEVVFVYKGQVDVTAQGKTVTVKEGFGTQVPKSAPPMQPMPLTSFKDFDPKLLSPAKLVPIKTEVKAPPKPLPSYAPPRENPSPAPRARSVVSKDILVNYRLQLSRDPKFSEIVLEKTEPTGQAFEIKKENIPDGNYFVRVAFIDALGVTGEYSAPSTIVKDTIPPEITDLVPEEGQIFEESEFSTDVAGVSKGATMVAINGQVVFLSPTGRFATTVHFKEGTNKIVILARDVNGNETVVKRTVTYKKGSR